MFNEMTYFNGVAETVPDMLKNIDKWGGPRPSRTWPRAGPWPATRRSSGPSRSPPTSAARATAWSSSWPKRIKAKGEMRSQFHHVIDIAPTVLEAAGIPEPKTVNGVEQTPMEGVSMVYTFDDAKAADRHTTQYFEMFGNRAIYHDGWVAAHRAQGPVGSDAAPQARRGRLGALQRRRGLQRGQRPGGAAIRPSSRSCRRCS